MKITLAIPTNRQIKPKTVQCALELVARGGYDFNIICPTEGYTIAENRAYIVWQAINNKSDYVLFLDDDMVFPADTLDRLIACNKDIVGVNAYSRKLPLSTTITFLERDYVEVNGFPQKPPMPTELFECKEVGGGVLLVKMDVFNKIDKPWFAFTQNESGHTTQGEDGWFCERARDKGISIWCDPTLPIGHLGELNYSLENNFIK